MTLIEHFDLAFIALYAFWLFFALLILYLRHEDRREGYPLVHETAHGLEVTFPRGGSPAKTFNLDHGGPTTPGKPEPDLYGKLQPTGYTPGSPYEPMGNPLLDGVGPASYALRADVPDLAYDDQMPKIIPLRAAPAWSVAEEDPDPRGWPVLAADGETVGTVLDLWIDRSDVLLRYLEVTTDTGRQVVMPLGLAELDERKSRVMVKAVTGAQFREAPGLANPEQITLREEDRVSGYFAGGFMYATPRRMGPVL